MKLHTDNGYCGKACLQISLHTNDDFSIRHFTDELLWLNEEKEYYMILEFDEPETAANAAIRTLARISGNLQGKLYVTHYISSVIRACIKDIEDGEKNPVYHAFDDSHKGYIKFSYN